MTVCIAAICQWANRWVIVGASDRMLTADDIEFEPPQTKIYTFTPTIVGLISGDGATQASIGDRVLSDLGAGTIVPSVREVAKAFAERWAEHRRNESETIYLSPLGLTLADFLRRQNEFSPDFIRQMTENLQKRRRTGDETIIAGIDPNGSAHIYVVREPGISIQQDIVGFAAVGMGEWHAKSQFMLAAYTKYWLFDRAVWLVYMAKRKAEVAPGVGKATDMFFIEASGAVQYILGDAFKKLVDTYTMFDVMAGANNEWAYGQIHDYITSLASPQAAAAQPPTSPSSEPRAETKSGNGRQGQTSQEKDREAGDV